MADSKFLTYLGKPLVRKGNEIYYGDMAESYVVRFEILSSKAEGALSIPDKISVKLLKSNPNLSDKERTVKETTKSTMFDALDFGFIWLDRALKEKQ